MFKIKYILINGNSFEEIQNLEYDIDLILTDPPYEISVDNNFHTMKDRTGRNGIDFGDWDYKFDITKINIFMNTLNKNGSAIIFHSFEQYGDLYKSMLDNNFVCKDRIIWRKTNPMPRNRDRRYISNCELASWYTSPKSKWTFNRQDEKYEQMILSYSSESGGGFKRYHPTQKSLRLIEHLLKIHSNEGDFILDPFMGSGTTGVACILNKRNFIGIELDKNYFDICVKRITDLLSDEDELYIY